MNDAQLFIIFSAILVFGWLGFLTGKAFETKAPAGWSFPAMIFFMFGTVTLLIAALGNLGSLVLKNWQL